MDGTTQVVRFDATTLGHLDAAEWAPSTASKADLTPSSGHVRFAPRKADIGRRSRHVRFVPEIGIGGSLSAPPLPHHRTYGSVYGGSRSCANALPSRRGDRAILSGPWSTLPTRPFPAPNA